MAQTLAIAAGGALGALLRYWVVTGVHGLLGAGFPYGTLAVNTLGSLLMGFLSVVLLERAGIGPELRAALLVGLLGSFTTFSSFSMETLNLLEGGARSKAAASVAANLAFCLLAVWAGVIAGRKL
ncbi:camphor resistance protein CrcB [Thiohalorhabdus denitrificans]|uniref:Fluoride-specific ion channel FluC n=1 Tax=Thiohalorhabdus denitrificans TaxID=381306 RepID=A0A0P9EKT3_9GAMM|nr:fluoride efflux transporter CrcB [Thiohalorhabdus denitrificans]KPV39167.1 camphor resistance protein CrcB [Thiohalorhabdus denitrificans]SCX75893.1 CrcB protein [Thiohalorhabdus denitrificans]